MTRLARFGLPLLLVGAFAVSIGMPTTALAVDRTWDNGGGDGVWTNPLNWTGDTAPGVLDRAVFDPLWSVAGATIDGNVSVQGVLILAGYTGTIAQAGANTLTVGSMAYSQAAGTFLGGTGAITVNNAFTLSGGSFTSTTGTLTVTGAFTQSGGAFAHNNGTMAFSTSNVTIDVVTSLALNNVSFLSGTKTIAAGDTLNVGGTLNLAGGLVNAGTVAAQGDITVQAGFTGNSTSTLLINGAGAQTVTGSHAVGSGDLPAVVINKPSGDLTLAAGGTGILRTTDNWTFTAVPGTFATTGTTLVFAGGTITGSHSLNNVEIRGNVTLAVGTTLTVPGSLNLVSGSLNQAAATGTLAAQGDITVQSTFTGGGSATLLINGAADQVVTGYHAVGSGDLPVVVINKPSGSLTLGLTGTGIFRTSRNWTFTSAPGGLVVTGTTLAFTGGTITGSHTLNNVDIRGNVTIAAGTTVTATGTTELFSGSLSQAAATGILAAQGNVNARIGFTGGGTATLLINGSGDQTFDGDHNVTTGSLPNVEVNKPNGSLTLIDTFRTSRNWTFTSAPGGLVVTGTTLAFTGGTITGSHTLNNVDIRGNVTIAAGTTVTATGTTELFSGSLSQAAATGILAAQGNVNARIGFTGGGTATLLINGSGDQTFDGDHNVTTGSLPNVEVNKPNGSLTLIDTFRTSRNWTFTSAPGGLVVTGTTLAFTGGTITGSHTLNNVDIRGNVTIAAGTTVTATGTTELFSGSLSQAAATGILAAQGNVNARIGFTGGGTATLLINGSGDQTFDGDHNVTTGSLPNVEVNKPNGSLTLIDTFRTSRNWTFTSAPGGLVVTGTTLAFTGGTITGSHTLNNVDIRGGTVTVAVGTSLTVAGMTTLTDGDLNGGTLEALGDLFQASAFDGETATIRVAGTTDQTFTGAATAGTDLPHLVIDKPSGTLYLVGTIRTTSVGWTWVAGTVDPGISTVIFNGSTITGSHTLHNVELNGGTVTIGAGTTLTVGGLTTLTDGDLNGGTLEALGDIALAGTFDGETGTLRIAGTTDQTLTSGATTTMGDMANVVIDKPSGTLSIIGTIRMSTAAWTWLSGAVDPGTSVLVLETGTTISGSHTLNDIYLAGGAHTVGAGLPTAGGTLTLDNGTIDGGTLGAAGNIDQLVSFDGGSGTLVVTGSADQTFTGASTAGSGDLPNIDINKTAGTLTLAGTLRLNGATWTHSAGVVDAATSTVVFSGTSGIGAAGMSFQDLTVNGGTTTLSQDLDVDADLLVMTGTLNAAGVTITVGGDVTIDGAFTAGTGALILDGGAPQTLGGAAAAIGLFDLTVSNATGVTTDSEVQVAGTLTLNGPMDFGGQVLGIAHAIAGTPTDLSGNPASSLEVFGTGSGIVIPASLTDLANLTVDNPNGAALGGPLRIGLTLNLTDGILRSRPWVLTMEVAGVVARTAGHVDGAFEKPVALGPGTTVTFEIGDSTTYAPLRLTFGMVNVNGTVTASTTAGEHPSIGTSPLDPLADVNRWWSLVNGGTVFDTVDVEFTWAPTDVDPGADPAAFVVAKWNAGWTLPAAPPATPTTLTATGLTSFSEFAIGELQSGPGLPDSAGRDAGGPDVGTRAIVVSALLLGLVAFVIGVSRRRAFTTV